jgi:hypothetical protein
MTLGSRVNPPGDSRAVGKSEELRSLGGRCERMALMYGQKASAGAAASLRGVSRKPHVVVCENRKNERL